VDVAHADHRAGSSGSHLAAGVVSPAAPAAAGGRGKKRRGQQQRATEGDGELDRSRPVWQQSLAILLPCEASLCDPPDISLELNHRNGRSNNHL
jgi:hypothetical protein